MEQTMQQVELNFRGDARVKYSRLTRGGVRADHDFTVLKGQHIGGAGDAAEFFVQRCHSPVAYNLNRNFVEGCDLGSSMLSLPHESARYICEPLQLARGKTNASLNISECNGRRRAFFHSRRPSKDLSSA
jgi:hypothetical protein